jgi:ParB-like chromosome segregation protein Spo0J
MVESLIENIHREDLTPTEKGKFCLKIMKEEGITDINRLSERVDKSRNEVDNWIDDFEFRKKYPDTKTSHKILRQTKTLPEAERKQINNLLIL